ncbi:hypothetical protein TUA1478L_25250 [Lactiplantibacillus plantarum]
MTANKRRFKAEIDGRTYTIIGTASDRHMQTVTRMMNEQVAQLKKLAPICLIRRLRRCSHSMRFQIRLTNKLNY